MASFQPGYIESRAWRFERLHQNGKENPQHSASFALVISIDPTRRRNWRPPRRHVGVNSDYSDIRCLKVDNPALLCCSLHNKRARRIKKRLSDARALHLPTGLRCNSLEGVKIEGHVFEQRDQVKNIRRKQNGPRCALTYGSNLAHEEDLRWCRKTSKSTFSQYFCLREMSKNTGLFTWNLFYFCIFFDWAPILSNAST